MDKYEPFTADDFEFAGAWPFLVIFVPIRFMVAVNLLNTIWGGVRKVAGG